MPEQEKIEQPSNWLEEAVTKEPAEKPETPETETHPEPQAKEKVEEKVEKVVPLAALHEERARRKEALQAQQELRQELEQLRRQQLEFMQSQKKPEVEPDASTDPVGALLHNQKRTQEQLDAMNQDRVAQQQRELARQHEQQFFQTVQAHEAQFTARQPDAMEGIEFLKSSRAAQYEAGGMSKAEAAQAVAHDTRQLVVWSLQRGENPAEVAYNMAVKGGYTPPEKKLEMQSRGQGATGPIAGGRGGGSIPSLETILKMDSKEFAKATEGDKWATLMKKHGA